MPNYEYIRTDNFLDLPTTMSEQHQPKSMNDEYNEIRKECIQRSFKSTQSSSIKSSGATSSNANNLQSQKSVGSSNNNTQRRRRSVDDNITNNHSTISNNTNNRLHKQNRRRHSISNNTPINNNSFVNSSQISNILQEHLLHSPPTLDDDNIAKQHKQASDVYNTKTTPQNVYDAINLEIQHRNKRDRNTTQNRKSRDSSTSPLPPTSELQRHLQRDSTTASNQSASVVSQRRGSSRRSPGGGGSLRDSNATILHSNQQKETQKNSRLGNGSNSRPKELVDSLQYSLDDSGKCNISLF